MIARMLIALALLGLPLAAKADRAMHCVSYVTGSTSEVATTVTISQTNTGAVTIINKGLYFDAFYSSNVPGQLLPDDQTYIEVPLLFAHTTSSEAHGNRFTSIAVTNEIANEWQVPVFMVFDWGGPALNTTRLTDEAQTLDLPHLRVWKKWDCKVTS